MTWADSETMSCASERMTPRARSASISATSTEGSSTTPLPMTHVFPAWRMPLGMRCEDRLLAAHHEGVPGVVPALETDDHLGVLGEQVDDLALSLVAPLGTDHHDVRHGGPGL